MTPSMQALCEQITASLDRASANLRDAAQRLSGRSADADEQQDEPHDPDIRDVEFDDDPEWTGRRR